jgi:hypothetical protein
MQRCLPQTEVAIMGRDLEMSKISRIKAASGGPCLVRKAHSALCSQVSAIQ